MALAITLCGLGGVVALKVMVGPMRGPVVVSAAGELPGLP
jgi:hypothetical protein